MTAPTTQAVQSLDDLMRLAGRLESLPLTFDVVMVRKQRAELRAGIESYVTSAISSHEAEVGRLREALEAARDHLNYMGYGDSWERECARADGLPDKIEKALSCGATAAADLSQQRVALEALAKHGTHHDVCPTRLLCNPATNELAGKIDAWWLSYFQGADAQVRKIASAALTQGETK